MVVPKENFLVPPLHTPRKIFWFHPWHQHSKKGVAGDSSFVNLLVLTLYLEPFISCTSLIGILSYRKSLALANCKHNLFGLSQSNLVMKARISNWALNKQLHNPYSRHQSKCKHATKYSQPKHAKLVLIFYPINFRVNFKQEKRSKLLNKKTKEKKIGASCFLVSINNLKYICYPNAWIMEKWPKYHSIIYKNKMIKQNILLT